MSEENKSKEVNFLHSLFKKGTVLGILLLLLIPLGLKQWHTTQERNREIRREIFSQFLVAKTQLILKNINSCLQYGKISKVEYNKRIQNRENLIKIVGKNINSIPSNAFFTLTQYTRFDYAPALQNLCALKKEQLRWLRGNLTDVQIQIRKELNL